MYIRIFVRIPFHIHANMLDIIKKHECIEITAIITSVIVALEIDNIIIQCPVIFWIGKKSNDPIILSMEETRSDYIFHFRDYILPI